jgi:adenylate cyclase
MTHGGAARSDGRVALGKVTVDLDAERVLDEAGRACALRPHAFAVLRRLLANPGRLVTKDELMQAVWPGVAVTDDSLVQCVGEIRRVLGEEGKGLLETVPRRGYRLAAPQAPRAATRRTKRAALAGALLLVILAPAVGVWRAAGTGEVESRTPAIAVLPFASMAGEAGDYLGPGVAEDVIAMLARSPDVMVMARGSSFAYGDAPRDVREIGAALGVDYVLEGSVRREGDKLRITAQLEDAETGRHVWAERFDRAGPDPWALVDEVSGQILAAVVGERGEIKRAQFREAWGKDTATLGEYDYFLRGLDVYMKARTPEENARAADIWAEGLKRYPGSALLTVKLGWSHWTAAWYYWSGDLAAHFREADRLVTEALAGDNLSPETQRSARWLNAFVLMRRGEFDAAVREAELTVALAPYDARMLRNLTDVLVADGRYEMALDWLARAEPREPGRASEYPIQRALVYRLMGRYEDSLREYASVDGMRAYPELSRAIVLVRLGRLDEAGEAVRRALEDDPGFTQAAWREGSFYSDPAVLEGEVAALAAAGLPDG